MSNKQYAMSNTEIKRFKEIKESSLYKDYINTIVNSPALLNVANEHVKHVDVTDVVDTLISKNTNKSAKKINELFKETIKSVAINMVADALIINDVVDLSVADAMEELGDNFKVKYLMGLADEEFYKRAEQHLEENPDTSSLIYIGYVEYKKRVDKGTLDSVTTDDLIKLFDGEPKVEKKETSSKSKTSSKKRVDINSNDIEF